MKLHAFGGALAAAMCLALCAQASAQEQVASVRKIDPMGTRQQGQDKPVVLALDSRLFSNDIIETSPKGRLDLTFQDGTQLAVGPDSRVTLDEYLYKPGARATAVLGVAKGALRFITGNVQRDGVRINTPTATIGIRGTDFIVRVKPDGATEVRVDRGIVRVWACDAARTTANAYMAEAGYSLAVETNCVVSVTVTAVTSPGESAPDGPGPAGAATASTSPGAPGGPAGGPGNGNGNGANANGGGNTGGSGPGTGNGGSNSGNGAGAANGGGGNGNGGAGGGGAGGGGGGAGGGGGGGGAGGGAGGGGGGGNGAGGGAGNR